MASCSTARSLAIEPRDQARVSSQPLGQPGRIACADLRHPGIHHVGRQARALHVGPDVAFVHLQVAHRAPVDVGAPASGCRSRSAPALAAAARPTGYCSRTCGSSQPAPPLNNRGRNRLFAAWCLRGGRPIAGRPLCKRQPLPGSGYQVRVSNAALRLVRQIMEHNLLYRKDEASELNSSGPPITPSPASTFHTAGQVAPGPSQPEQKD